MSIDTMAIRKRAAELIVERGWWDGRDVEKKGRLCLAEAIYDVSGDDNWDVVNDELRQELGVSFLTAYNDAPGRTEAEVVRALLGSEADEETRPLKRAR